MTKKSISLLLSLLLFALIPSALAANTVRWTGAVDFLATGTEGPGPLRVKFENRSWVGYGQVTYRWDFGDGTTSVEVHPLHVYRQPGNFTVTLTQILGESSRVAVRESLVKVYDLAMLADFEDQSNYMNGWIIMPHNAHWQGDGAMIGDGYLTFDVRRRLNYLVGPPGQMNGDDVVTLGPSTVGTGDCEYPNPPCLQIIEPETTGHFSWYFDLGGVEVGEGSMWRMFSLLRDQDYHDEASQLVNVDLRFHDKTYWIRFTASQRARPKSDRLERARQESGSAKGGAFLASG